MAQNTWTIPSVSTVLSTARENWNAQIDNLVTLHSGTSAPSTTFPFMWWADTTNNILKMRNSADDGWWNIALLRTGGGLLRLTDASTESGTFDATTHKFTFTDGVSTYYIPANTSTWA